MEILWATLLCRLADFGKILYPQRMPTALFFSSRLWICLLCLVLATGCIPARHAPRSTEAPAVPRADPGHTRWLERQSVLGRAPELAAIVSGSPLGWRRTGRDAESGGMTSALLRRADIWLQVEEGMLRRDKLSALAELERLDLPGLLAERGIRGLFLAPSHARGAFWNDRNLSGQPGEDAVSLGFAEHMGTDAEFSRLSVAAAAAHIVLGGDILPAAPGRGPDFLLALANLRDYPGAWIMLDMPREHWSALPAGAGVLTPEQHTDLAQQGLLLPQLCRDSLPAAWGLPPGGWAASAETAGTDGLARRWVYRYDANPDRPVLNWDDPSAAAKRMLSASAIREIGVLRTSLAGLHLTPLIGLQRSGVQALPDTARLEPALSALHALTGEISRYGGYSLEREALPLELARALLAGGADFVVDPATFPFAEYALVTGDAAPLRRAFDAALAGNLPQNRLLRPLSRPEGIPIVLLPEHAQNVFSERARAAGWPEPAVLSGTIRITVPALAAMRLNMPPQDAARPAERAETASALHELLLAFRAGLPGMIWLTGQDLYGITRATLDSDPADRNLPAWTPDPELQRSSAAGISLYAPATLPSLPRITAMRRELDVAAGLCLARPATRHPGSILVLSRLPGGDRLLVAANFSDAHVSEILDLPGAGTLEHVLGRASLRREDGHTELILPALSWAWLRARP